jgi:tetratricopeptide (TPR) repeat protein
MLQAYLGLGAFDSARRVALDALSLCDSTSDLGTSHRAYVINQLGIAELWGGDPESALEKFLEAFRLSALEPSNQVSFAPPSLRPPAGDPIVALNVGSALRALKRYDEASEWTSQAFAQQTATGRDPALDAVFLSARAELEEARSDLAKAEASYRRSLEIFEGQIPSFHPRVVRACVGLARTLRARGSDEESALIARQALDAATGRLKTSHPLMDEARALAGGAGQLGPERDRRST